MGRKKKKLLERGRRRERKKGRLGRMGRWVGLIETGRLSVLFVLEVVKGKRWRVGGVWDGITWQQEERAPRQMKRKASRERGTRTEEWSGGQWRREKGLLLRPGCSLSGDGGGGWTGDGTARSDRI